MKMTNGKLVISMILVPLFWIIYLSLTMASMIRFKYRCRNKIPRIPKWVIDQKECEDFGKRMENYPKCNTCPVDMCESCSIETLRKRFRNSGKKIEVITLDGSKVWIS